MKPKKIYSVPKTAPISKKRKKKNLSQSLSYTTPLFSSTYGYKTTNRIKITQATKFKTQRKGVKSSKKRGQRKRPATTTGFGRISKVQQKQLYEFRKKERFFDSYLPSDFITTEISPIQEQNETLFTKTPKIEESFTKLFDLMTNPKIHPNIKSRYYQDLFQISFFYLNQSKLFEKKYTEKTQENFHLQQEVNDLKNTTKTDFDLIIKNPSKSDFMKMQSSVEELKTEIYNFKKDLKSPHEKIDDIVVDTITTDIIKNVYSVDRYLFFITQKFILLEDFVVFLKKKISILEQSDDDLRSLGQNFGSIKQLLEENKKISKQNNLLLWVKKRFDKKLLLNRNVFKINNLQFLKTFIFALQNELFYTNSCLSQLIPFSDCNKGKGDKLCLVKKYPVDYKKLWKKKFCSLDKLVGELCENEDEILDLSYKKEQNLTKEEKIIKNMLQNRQNDNDELEDKNRDFNMEKKYKFLDKIRGLEEENDILKQMTIRYKSQNKELEKSLRLLESQMKRTVGKFQLKELDTSLRRQLNEISRLNFCLEEREKFYIFQEKLLEKNKKEKVLLMNKNIKLVKKINEILCVNKNLKEKFVMQKNGCKVLKNISVSLINWVFEKKGFIGDKGVTGIGKKNCYLNFMYEDLFKNYLKLIESTVKIQAFWRGFKVRKKIKNGEFDYLKENKKRNLTKDVYKTKYKVEVVVKKDLDNKKEENICPKKMKSTFNTVYLLQKSNIIASEKFKSLKKFSTSLNIIKTEILAKLKKEILMEMKEKKKDFENISEKLFNKVKQKENRLRIERSVQTDKKKKCSVGAQIGVTQISKFSFDKKKVKM